MTITVIATITITIAIVQHEQPQVYMYTFKISGNWTVDSAGKTGSEICSPQDSLSTFPIEFEAAIVQTMTVRHREILLW
jgi:hypothetical protein